MYKINPLLIEKCRTLRKKGFTFGEIIKIAHLPKTTIYVHTHDVRFSLEGKERLRKIYEKITEENTKRIIDEKYKEIIISRKPNLIKFRDEINFSKGIYINPKRKNSIWKKKLEKRKILDHIINLYKT